MASFQPKIGYKRPRNRENKNYRSVPFPTSNRKFKKTNKKIKKIKKNTIMDSFQAIIGWKRMKKRENKNYHFVSFLPDA